MENVKFTTRIWRNSPLSELSHAFPQVIRTTPAEMLTEDDLPVPLGAVFISPLPQATSSVIQSVLKGIANRAVHLVSNFGNLGHRLTYAGLTNGHVQRIVGF